MIRKRSTSSRPRNQRGGALLAVLWLSAALAAISFSVATTVRGELERASTLSDGIRAHYLAKGAVERALMWCIAGQAGGPPPELGPGTMYFSRSTPRMSFPFPAGEAVVEVIPETAKLNINTARPGSLMALLMALGATQQQAFETASAIAHWRSPGAGPLDEYYLGLGPTFRPRHASVMDVEELIHVKGMTPEIFHGNYQRDPNGRMVRLGAFKDCVSPWGSNDSFDVNTVEPALMAAAGIAPEAVGRIVEMRNAAPIVRADQMAAALAFAGPAGSHLRIGGGNTIYTLRATARLRLPDGRLGDLGRTVSATVKFLPASNRPPYHVLSWNDQAVSGVPDAPALAYPEVRAWR